MKLDELFEQKQKGTYAGIRFSENTVNDLLAFIKKHNIPNGLSKDELHSTLLYSRKHLPKYKGYGKYDEPLIGTPKSFTLWESNHDDPEDTVQCLVLLYDCKELTDRHNELMDEHKATYDFPEYTPHVTLTYDIGDLKYEFDIKEIKPLEIESEYDEELQSS